MKNDEIFLFTNIDSKICLDSLLTFIIFIEIYGSQCNIYFILTKPAIIRPPIVPCDVIDAIAILVANDQSSFLVGNPAGPVTNLIESTLSAGDTKAGGIWKK